MINIIKARHAVYIYYYCLMSVKFPREEKLKSKKHIQQLFDEGSAISDFPLKLIYCKIDKERNANLKMAVSVPKKKFKSAVHRNRVKRLIRETYRLHKAEIFNKIEGSYALLFLYLGKEMPQYATIEKHMIKILELFLKRVQNEKNAE